MGYDMASKGFDRGSRRRPVRAAAGEVVAVTSTEDAVSPGERTPRRRATLAAVAAEAGVSLPTVSKVVNGRPDVAPETRAGWSGCSASSTTTAPARAAGCAAAAGPGSST